MARWLGLDHGSKRIGVAAGDTADEIASPVDMVPAKPHADALAKIAQLASDYSAVGIVVGWPLNMDDTEGPQGVLARAFAAELADATALEVRLWDERLSSFAAREKLSLAEIPAKKQKRYVDALAAAEILQAFLEQKDKSE